MAAIESNETLYAFAPAKINLFLHVTGRRPNGYHEIDSLVVFADVGDHLTATPAKKWGLSISGPFAHELKGYDPNDNLVLRAAKLTEEWAWGHNRDLPALHFTLEKHLPVASGIGGGSSDAAAAIRICAKAAGLDVDEELMTRAATLGADVPVCLLGRPAWVSGIGERLEQAVIPDGLALVLVNPGVAIPTAEVFALHKDRRLKQGLQDRADFSTLEELEAFLQRTDNDLERNAAQIAPIINDAIDAIEKTSPVVSGMSGSGATCFGLFVSDEAAQQAASALRAAHHNWWVVDCGLMRP